MAKQHYSFCHVLQMNPCESKKQKGKAVFDEEDPDLELYMKTEPIQQVQRFISTTKISVETEQESDLYRSEREYFTSGDGLVF